MKRALRNTRSLAALATLLALAAFDAVHANHFILPCRDACLDARWVMTGSLDVARTRHTATLLTTGKVLVAGGYGDGILASAELYDPATGAWGAAGYMALPRVGHTATLLSDGRVLVAGGDTGGWPPDFGRTDSAEIYDPATGRWSPTGSMGAMRSSHAAALLQDGRVLVAGGFNRDNIDSAELYDPQTGAWSATGSLNVARWGHTMTLLQDGTVLAARGSDSGDLLSALSSTEVYDPLAGTWNVAGDSGEGSVMHSATLLPNGKVLVAGGNGGGVGGSMVFAAAMLFDPATRVWSRAGDLLARRYDHAAAVLPNGEVLVAGGEDQSGRYPTLRYASLATMERFDPRTDTWSSAADLNVARSGHTMTLLADGTILAAGGSVVGPAYTTRVLATAERHGATAPAARSLRPSVPGHRFDDAAGDHGSFRRGTRRPASQPPP